MLRAGLTHHRPCLVFLKRRKTLIQWGSEVGSSLMSDLVSIQRDVQRPLILLPMLVIWDQKPETYRRTFVDMVFGDPQAPGKIRKILSFVFNFRRARTQVGRPLDLAAFLAANTDAADEEDLGARLKFELSREFRLVSKAIRGPVLKGARRMIDEVMRTPPFLEEIHQIAASEGASDEGYAERARSMLKRMAADFRINWLESFCTFLGLIFQRLFRGIVLSQSSLAEIREAAREAPIIIMPAHRSHMDYLIISLLFYTNGLIPPHIAAGDNLTFWPMGPIFRHSGAFFLRRSTRGNRLYSAVLRQYVRKLLKEGYWIEFFIEGTRSRSGKSLPPKYGMLSMVIDAVASGAAPDAMLVPAAITYEKVVEAKSYQKESGGAAKQAENITTLARGAKAIVSRYGHVYVNFEKPFSLVGCLREAGVAVPLNPGEEVPREVVVRMANLIMQRINRCLVVTVHHLVAFVLLTNPKRGIERTPLQERVGALIEFITERGAILSDPTRENLAEQVDDALRMFHKDRLITIRQEDDDWIVSPTEEGRTLLEYYKNGIVHFFVPEALIATATTQLGLNGPFPREALSERTQALCHLFRAEFMCGDTEAGPGFDGVLGRFLAERMLRRDAEGLVIEPGAAPALSYRSRVLEPFVQAYGVLTRAVLQAPPETTDNDLIKAALKLGRKLYELGDVALSEAVSAPSMRNALACLHEDVASGRALDLKAAATAMAELLGVSA